MLPKNRKIKILVVILLIFILSGCWDYKEMVDYADVTAIAIDKGDKKRFKLTMEGRKFSPSVEIKVEAVLFESDGDTIIEALRSVIKNVGKRVNINSVKSVIISEELAKDGINQIVDLFYRNSKARFLTGMYLAKGTEASSLLKDTAVYSEFAGLEIGQISSQISSSLGYEDEHQLYKVVDRIMDEYKEPMLFGLELVDQPDGKKTFSAAGLACFKDNKIIGFIEDDLISSYAILVNKYRESVISVKYKDNGFLGLSVFVLSSNRTFKVIDGKVNMYLNVKMEIGYSENGTDIAYIEDITKKEINELASQYFEEKIQELHQFAKDELKHDVLEIEEMFRKKNYREWKKINKDFDFLNDTIIHPNFKVTFRGAGQVRIK